MKNELLQFYTKHKIIINIILFIILANIFGMMQDEQTR
jgi:hypothetical protein